MVEATPEWGAWSAIAKASARVVFSLATRNRFWFGMMIWVSTAFLQLEDAGLGVAHAALALEVERLGDHADREDAELFGHPGDDRCCAGAGAAAHAGGDEHHVRAREMIADLVDHLLGRGTADIRLGAGAETLGHLHAHLDDPLGLGRGQRLGIGVGDHEVDALKPGRDHVVDSVAARASHTEHGHAAA